MVKDYEIIDLSRHSRSDRIIEISFLSKLIVPKQKSTWNLHPVALCRDKIASSFKLPFDDALYFRIYFIPLLWPSSSLVNTNARQGVPRKSPQHIHFNTHFNTHFHCHTLLPVLSKQIQIVRWCFFLSLQIT